MSEKFKCGDQHCWRYTMTGIAKSKDCKEETAKDLKVQPFHRGWWQKYQAEMVG